SPSFPSLSRFQRTPGLGPWSFTFTPTTPWALQLALDATALRRGPSRSPLPPPGHFNSHSMPRPCAVVLHVHRSLPLGPSTRPRCPGLAPWSFTFTATTPWALQLALDATALRRGPSRSPLSKPFLKTWGE